jgi:autotransporter-associated beta strand protein
LRQRTARLESLEGRALMATLTWDGNNGNGKNVIWSAWSNWSPDRAPQNGDSLVFQGTRKLSNVNDLNLTLSQIILQGNGFAIDGNGITLGSGGLHLVGGSSASFGLPINLANSDTPFETYGARTLYLNDSIGGTGGFAKYGVGTAVLSAAGTFSGATTIFSGILQLNHPGALQQSTLVYNNDGGTLNFGGQSSAVLGGLQGSQALALVNSGGSPVALSVGNNGQDTVYVGVLSGAGSLKKIGAGTLILTGQNNFTGQTTVNAGTLTVNGALSDSHVVIINGTLAGSGRVNSLAVTGGVVSPRGRCHRHVNCRRRCQPARRLTSTADRRDGLRPTADRTGRSRFSRRARGCAKRLRARGRPDLRPRS